MSSTKNLAAAVERARTEHERASVTFASAEARASKARGIYDSSSGSDAAADELGRAKIALELATERRDATRVALDAAETALSAAETESRERAERASREAERKARLDALRSAASLDTYQGKTDPLVAEVLRAHDAMTRAFDGIAEAFDATNAAAKTLREEGEECPDLHELHLLGPVIREMGGIVGGYNFGTISSRARFDAARDAFKDVVIGAPGSRGGQFELERDVLAVQLECRALPEMLEARREVELATGACDCDAPAVARHVEDIGGRVGAKCSACHRPLPLKSLEAHEDGAHVVVAGSLFHGTQGGERVQAKFPHSGIERAMSRAKARSTRKGSAAAAVEAPAAKRGSLARVAALFENLVGRHFRSARPAREEAIAPSPPAVETAPTDAEDEETLAPVEPLPSLGQDAGSPW